MACEKGIVRVILFDNRWEETQKSRVFMKSSTMQRSDAKRDCIGYENLLQRNVAGLSVNLQRVASSSFDS